MSIRIPPEKSYIETEETEHAISRCLFKKATKNETILAPFFKFLEVVFDLMVPVVIAHMIDVGIAENNRGVIIRSFFDSVLMAGAGLTVSITAQFFRSKSKYGICRRASSVCV